RWPMRWWWARRWSKPLPRRPIRRRGGWPRTSSCVRSGTRSWRPRTREQTADLVAQLRVPHLVDGGFQLLAEGLTVCGRGRGRRHLGELALPVRRLVERADGEAQVLDHFPAG